MQVHSIKSEISQINENFKSITEQIATIIFEAGKIALPYHDPSMLVFEKLEAQQKKKVLQDASLYLESLNATEAYLNASNVPLDKGFEVSLWSALKYFGLRPMSDLFSYLNGEKIVEVYDSQGIQIWRNLNFFKVCGYTIEEMFCYTWMERYERNDTILEQIFAIISRFLNGESETIKCNIQNRIKELISSQKLTIDAHHEYVSPLYDKRNQYSGFIVISSAQVTVLPSQAILRPNASL